MKAFLSPAPQQDAPAAGTAVSLAHSQVGRDLRYIEQEIHYHSNTDAPTNESDDALEIRYLEWLFDRLQHLNLSGINLSSAGQQQRCVNLAEVYTALWTRSAEAGRGDGFAIDGRERLRSALEMVNETPRLVLLGEPGSGKSTFVDFLALCLAGERLNDPCANLARLIAPMPDEQKKEKPTPQTWAHGALIPIKIVLRDFAASVPTLDPKQAVNALLAFLEGELERDRQAECKPALERALQDGRALIMFDGLDEVSEAEDRRQHLIALVEQFARVFRKNRVLVTCRTYAYQRQQWALPDFAATALSPFTDPQISQFIEVWYQHLATIKQVDASRAEGNAARLKEAVFQRERRSDRLHEFARRPLLLTLMASLHAWHNGELPEKRGELYAKASELLLYWWEQRKTVEKEGETTLVHESLSELLNVGKEALLNALKKLAFQAHSGQPELVGTADIAEDALSRELWHISENPHLKVNLLKTHLSDRAGLLVPRGVNVYSFPHRSFQEFLAAAYCYDHPDHTDFPVNIAQLTRREPERWREVALLAAQLCNATALWRFVEELCQADPATSKEPKADAYGALFAAQALDETKSPANTPALREKKERLRRWLKAILTEWTPEPCQGSHPWQGYAPLPAIDRALAGDLLAEFGDDRKGVGVILITHPLPLPGGDASDNSPPGRGKGWVVPDIAWITIPAGEFWMGSDESKDEQPRHRVTFREPFQISRYPITNAQYEAFVKAGGYRDKRYWNVGGGWEYKEKYDWTGPRQFSDARFGLANHPVVGVSWYEAMAFCEWLTAITHPQPLPGGENLTKTPLRGGAGGGLVVRLPTEAEWEYAARGKPTPTPSEEGIEERYPWGDDISPEHANYADTNIGATNAVGCFPRGKSRFSGCEEMAGNAFEWCLDVWQENYKNAPDDGSALLHGKDEDYRVIRGGYYGASSDWMRCAYRCWDNGRPYRFNGVGFRVVLVGSGLLAVSPC